MSCRSGRVARRSRCVTEECNEISIVLRPGRCLRFGEIATDLKNAASERTAAIDADAALQKLRDVSNKATDLRDAASRIKGQSKPVFQKLDELTKDEDFKFSDWQKQERAAYRRGDFDVAQKAKAEQERIIDRFKDQFNPRDLQTARENWRQASALEDVHNTLNKKSVVGPTPIDLRPKGVPDPGVIDGKNFAKEILKMANDGTLQKAGLTPEHIQSLQDLGSLLENGGAQRRFSRLLTPKNAAAAEAIGLILHPPSAVAAAKVAAPAYAASQALGKIMTDPNVAAGIVSALKTGAKVGPGVSANAYRRAQSEMKRRSLP